MATKKLFGISYDRALSASSDTAQVSMDRLVYGEASSEYAFNPPRLVQDITADSSDLAKKFKSFTDDRTLPSRALRKRGWSV